MRTRGRSWCHRTSRPFQERGRLVRLDHGSQPSGLDRRTAPTSGTIVPRAREGLRRPRRHRLTPLGGSLQSTAPATTRLRLRFGLSVPYELPDQTGCTVLVWTTDALP